MIVTHSSRLQRHTALVSNILYGSSDEEDGEEEDEEGPDSWHVSQSHTDAAAAMDVLMCYFEQYQQATEYDIQPLSH